MRTIGCIGLALATGIAWAQQNRLPPEEARAYARLCAERAAAVLADTPIKTEVDAEKPCAERGEGGGAMVIPDKNLTEKALAGVGQGVLPVGQLWLRKWTLVVGGKPVGKDRLRIVNVRLDGKDRPMPLFLLGVRKKGTEGLELVIYARDSEPIQVVPLRKSGLMQDLPVQLEWARGEKDGDNLTLNVLGQYEGTLKVARTGK